MKTILQTLYLFIFLTLLTGGVYPLIVTGIGRLFFQKQVGGSLVEKNGRPVGSRLLAQKFSQPRYFWPRPSAADYATLPSGASNLGPTSAGLKNRTHGSYGTDMDTMSGGLDPHISPRAALLQIPRVAQARRLPPEQLAALIHELSEPPQWGLFGEPRVNVLELNLRLDAL